MKGYIDNSEWSADGYDTRVFEDIDTLKFPIANAADYSLALRIAANWLKQRDIGVVQTARNDADTAWLALCFPESGT